MAASSNTISLVGPAMPLLQLLARLRTMATQPDPADLRQRTEAELHRFEQRAAAEGVPADQVRRGHYALCAGLDDAVMNTPWGSGGAWAERPLVATFHPAVGADRFFDVLHHAGQNAAEFRAVLELMYVCLSLGFLGRYRGTPDGAAAIEGERAAASDILGRLLPPVHVRLSAAWKGVQAPYVRRRAGVPLWVVASVGLAVVGGVLILAMLDINERSDALFAQLLSAPPSHMPALTRAAIPPPPDSSGEPSLQDRLRSRLQPLLAAHRITLAGTPAMPILRLPEGGLFAANSARLLPEAAALLDAVSAALKPEDGRLRVIGYSDDRPVHTVLFPSSFQLSAARAEAVRASLAQALGDAARGGGEGRASAEPVASNATAEGREQNRRIEIVVTQAAAS
jgi:type VI secretion system protein ImpK